MTYDCHNRIDINGDPDLMIKLTNTVATPNSQFSFAKIMPPPTTLRETNSPLHTYQYVGETKHKAHRFVALNKEGIIQFERELTPDQFFQLRNFEPGCMACWCTEHWGCKWEPDCVELLRYADTVSYDFHTPSFPPYGIINELRGKFPRLHISGYFHNENMEKVGYY